MLHWATPLAAFLPSFAWTLLTGVFFLAGDIVIRDWFAHHWKGGFSVAIACYILGSFAIALSFFNASNIAVATLAAIVINVVGYLLVAHVIYGDFLTTRQLTGMVLGMLALVILEIG